MPLSHTLLAIFVALVWGINFLFVGIALESFPPLFLCAVRFLLASVPALFFIRPPKAPWHKVVVYGLVMFALQFSLLFIGMSAGMPSGMASLLMQVQVFFSLFFAAAFLQERPGPWQIIGAVVAFCGIALVALHLDAHVTPLGFICILAGAATWGVGNLLGKGLARVNMIALVIWGSAAACVPMFGLSFVLEGPQRISETYALLDWSGIIALLYIVYVSTWAGYGAWNFLLARYPVGLVVPFTLLVPLVGMMSSVLILGEPMYRWKWTAAFLVLGGLGINLLGPRLFPLRRRSAALG